MANSIEPSKIGLVLEGGALRGMYTAGVLDTFLEEGIDCGKIVGVSAGALFGVNYVSEQKGRAIRYNKRFNGDRHYMGLIPFLTEGSIFSTKYAYEVVPTVLDPFDNETFMQSHREFTAVITGLKTGVAEYIPITDVFAQMDVLRASGSMPVVSQPVNLENKLYLDGAVADSIPYAWMQKQGVTKMIVVLTQDISYRKGAMPAPMVQLYKRKYPKFAKAMANRHIMYNAQTVTLRKLEAAGKVFVIRPSKPIKIGKLERNPENLQKVYELGISDTRVRLNALREYLEQEET